MNDIAQGKSFPFISEAEAAAKSNTNNSPDAEEKPKPIYIYHDHFTCSEHDHVPPNSKLEVVVPSQEETKAKKTDDNKETRDLWEADTYRYQFNFSVFLKSLLISITDILGLKVLLLLYHFVSASKFLNNFYRFGIINTWIVYLGWINMLLIVYSIYQKTWIYSDAQSLSYMVSLLFLSIIGAAEMSFINRKFPPLLETVKLSGESCMKAGCLREVDLADELKKTILRLNFDASSFFMGFIEHNEKTAKDFHRVPDDDPDQAYINWLTGLPNDPNQSNMNQLAVPIVNSMDGYQNTRNTQNEMKQEEDRLILNRPIDESDLIATAVKFEYAVFFYKYLIKPSRYDGKKAHAYRYAQKMLGAYHPKYPYAYFLMVVGVIGTIIVSFMKFDASHKSSEPYAIGYLVKGILLSLNGVATGATLYYISEGIDIIWNRLCFIKGLTEFICEEKHTSESIFRKKNSMINIFDFESLRTWAALRMIFMNLNQKRLDSISLAISIIVAIQLMTITVLGFFYFTSEGQDQKAFFLQYIIFFGTPTVVYMIFVLLFISIGAQVNNQYQEHIYRLKTLKFTIYKLFTLYPTFTGENCIQPSTYLYARGLRYLQKEFEDNDPTPAFLKEKLEIINEAYDTIIAELEVQEQNRPLKLLGIPMTDSFTGTLFGTIFTVLMIPVGKYLAEITGWD